MAPTLRRPPAPGPGHWLYGHLLERRARPLDLFRRMGELGDVSCFRAAWLWIYFVNHPDHVKHLLVDNAQAYWKGRIVRGLKRIIGEGLLTAEGETWKRNRRLAQPAFHRERLGRLVGSMVEGTREMLDRWEDLYRQGVAVDVAEEMMGLTMSIVGRVLFTTDVSGARTEVGRAMAVAIEEANVRLMSLNPLRPYLPTRRNAEFRRAMQVLDSVVFRIIQERRQGRTSGDDLLAMLMEATDAETGERMNDQQLRDEVLTLFIAGHETTANALGWLWYLLGQNPGVRDRLISEVHAVLGDNRAPTLADLPKLAFVQRAFDEAMRLYPPAWLVGRESRVADEIGGYRIPDKTIVAFSPYLLHRHPAFWPDPEKFDPDRFTPEAVAQRPRYAYVPFGAGQRMCIGNNLALMEAQIIVAMVAQRFRLDLVPGHAVEPLPLVTLRQRDGVRVTLERAQPLARSA